MNQALYAHMNNKRNMKKKKKKRSSAQHGVICLYFDMLLGDTYREIIKKSNRRFSQMSGQ
jgi:hypothetical protein